MKSILTKAVLVVFLATLTTACHINGFNKIAGNKNVISKERNISEDFTKIKVSQGITVYLTMSNKTSLTVEADENLHDIIKTEVSNGVLKIYTEETIRRAKSRNVYISAPNVNAVEASSGSRVIGRNTLITTNFNVSTSSGANVNLIVNTENITSSSSSGSLIKLEGKAYEHTSKASSGSSIKAYKLKSTVAIASVSSGARIDINATEDLSAKASSGGGIGYKGNPKKIERKSSSGGNITSH